MILEWILIAAVYTFSTHGAITVPGFTSEAQCERFGKDLKMKWRTSTYVCVERR